MWDTRKLILAAVVFTVLDCKNVLDMFPNTVDDRYHECREKAMKKFITSGLLTEELELDEEFKEAWSKNNCSKTTIGTTDHTTALSAFANGNESFIDSFNDAVKTMGGNSTTYENSFNFKSFHFLLMDAISLGQKLNTEQCRTVYFVDHKSTAAFITTVRLGGFHKAYTSLSKVMELYDLNEKVLFKVTSCFFVNLGDNICNGEADTVLLSPTEQFLVTHVTTTYDGIKEEGHTEVGLDSPEPKSFHNCYIFSRSPAGVSTQWLMLVLVVLPFID